MISRYHVGLLPALLTGRSEGSSFTRRAATFVFLGLVLYIAIYAVAERVVSRSAHRNRFFVVRSAPPAHYDAVILGASHAAVFDYRDMNRQLEDLTGARVVNLAVVGGGVLVNRVVLEYFLARHSTELIVYVVDSFAFYSPAWNERRLEDTGLFARAPFDPALARILLRRPASIGVALEYISGFSKINNLDRVAPDTFADETSRFERVYRPVAQIDRQRMAYLYPRGADPAALERYLSEFVAMVEDAHARGIRFLVVKPPVPSRVHGALPQEDRFDAALQEALRRHGVAFHDFSHTGNEDSLFYDTDHLNQVGVRRFFESALAPLITAARRR